MKQVLHIFGKDVRHLWPQILVTLGLFVSFDVLHILSSPLDIPERQHIDSAAGLVTFVLTLAIWYLVVLAVQQEPLPGDRQFWLTKPYSRLQLLAAKVLFVVLFVNVPLVCSDFLILGAQGLPVFSSISRILLRQLPFAALFVLPSFANATVTRNVTQFVFAWFVALLGFSIQPLVSHGGNGTAINFFSVRHMVLVLGAIAFAIVVWQYLTRQTVAGRIALIALTCAGIPAFAAVSQWAACLRGSRQSENRGTGPASIRILETGQLRAVVGQYPPPEGVNVEFLLDVEGLPQDALLEGNGVAVVRVGGKEWPGGSQLGTSIARHGSEYWQTVHFDDSMLRMLKQQPIDLNGQFRFRLLTDTVQTTIAVTARSFRLPNVGSCHSVPEGDGVSLGCRIGPDSDEMSVRIRPEPRDSVFSAFPRATLPIGLNPTSDYRFGWSKIEPSAVFQFIPRREVATFERSLSIRNVDLAKYLVHRAER